MGTRSIKLLDKFIYVLIIFNVVAMVLESHNSILLEYASEFHYFETFSIIIFVLEYIYRLRQSYVLSGVKGVGAYALSFFGVIDLLSILPFFLAGLSNIDGRFIRILRLFRLTRIFKLGRNSESFNTFIQALVKIKNELYFTLFLSMLMILFSASAIYFLEHEAQPEKFSSITESIWWASISLATVGYGDVYPVTVGGKIFAAIISLVGIGIVAIPTGIISASFVEEISEKRRRQDS
ncbi:MAG: ion transporter [Flavobacteriaceae bacterium]